VITGRHPVCTYPDTTIRVHPVPVPYGNKEAGHVHGDLMFVLKFGTRNPLPPLPPAGACFRGRRGGSHHIKIEEFS